MPLTNVEGLLVAALKADPDVSTIVGARADTELPPKAQFPAVRVSRFGGGMAVSRRLDGPDVQLDCWAKTRAEAWSLASAVVDLVERLHLTGTHRLGVVTGSEIRSVSYDPEEERDPVLPRYIIDARIWAHRP